MHLRFHLLPRNFRQFGNVFSVAPFRTGMAGLRPGSGLDGVVWGNDVYLRVRSREDVGTMERVSSRTHAMRAVIELREKIVSGEIPGGTRLFEVSMAESLNISRTPVREAMSRLAEEGLLDRARGGGFTVRTFGFADVVDAIELRGVLEGTAARLAAERGADP